MFLRDLSIGIGLMMARALALNGAHKIYILGRRKEVLDKAAASVPTKNIIPLVTDVTSKEALSKAVSAITSDVGYINVLVANSGILGPQASTPITPASTIADFQRAWGDVSFEDYNDAFRVNVVAAWFTVVTFLGLLDEGNKKGNVTQKSQVIVTSSIGGFNRAVPGGFAYGQSKAAASHLAKQLATNLVPFSIRSNVIAPGCKFCRFFISFVGSGKCVKLVLVLRYLSGITKYVAYIICHT
jgi:NAD(P)-dependent dehydrogenase (short-subunit alcohol dehydrogenase family)